MAANAPVDGQHGASVVASSFRSGKSKSVGARPTGRGGSGNIRQRFRPSVGTVEEDKMTSPSGREIKTGAGSQSLTGRGGAGNVETTSKQRLEEARAFLQKEQAILAQHQQEMRRHEKRAVGRGGAGNLQRKKNATVPKEFGFPGAQVGSKLFKTVTRSSRTSSERSVIDISRADRDSDLWSIADSTMSRSSTSTAGIIISKFGETLRGRRQQRPITNNANAAPSTVTGVCYSDASLHPNPRVDSPYSSTRRTPNEVAPFEEPAEPSPVAAAVFNTASSSSRQPRPRGPVLKRLVSGWSTDEYSPATRSVTSSNFSFPYSYDDTASFDSNQSRRAPARSASPMVDIYRQPGLSALLHPPRRVDSIDSSITNDFVLPPVSMSASAALRMVARSPQDGDRFSDRTGMRSSGSSFYAGQYSGASTETESRSDYPTNKTLYPPFNHPSHRASTGRYGTPHSSRLSFLSRFSVATTHSASSAPHLESFTPTFGMKELPPLPAASVHSFDECSFASPPSTPLPGSVYSEDAYDSDDMTIPDPHTRQPS